MVGPEDVIEIIDEERIMKSNVVTVIEELNFGIPVGNEGNYCCTVWIYRGDLEHYTDYNLVDWRTVSYKVAGPLVSELAEKIANGLESAFESGGIRCLRVNQADD